MLAVSLIVLTFLLAYLLGAIPFGWLVAQSRGIDIRKHGSGNIGATNVGRVLGRKYGILVFVLDFAKGALPVAVAPLLAQFIDESQYAEMSVALGVTAGIAAFLGHLFPVYLLFRGGKGVATGAGVVAVLMPLPALAAVLTWLIVALLSRYVSLASIFAACALCLGYLLLTPQPWQRPQLIVTLFCLFAASLVILRHVANIRRLLAGTENRL